ncbi:hypothetical protein WA158_000900 [Blastocystis sp. Blastoise]
MSLQIPYCQNCKFLTIQHNLHSCTFYFPYIDWFCCTDNVKTQCWVCGFDSESGYEEGPVERLKANIIEIISTMESRNNLLFLPYAKTITEKVWNILSDVKYKEEDRYNTIYKNRLTYFASMSKLPSNQSLFTGESLKIIIQNIIIPCLLFTDDDMNNYEDMPYEYIQNELEDANCNSCKRGVMMYFNYDINANNVSFLGAVESLPMAGKRSMPLSIYVYIFWIPNSDARHQRL